MLDRIYNIHLVFILKFKSSKNNHSKHKNTVTIDQVMKYGVKKFGINLRSNLWNFEFKRLSTGLGQFMSQINVKCRFAYTLIIFDIFII